MSLGMKIYYLATGISNQSLLFALFSIERTSQRLINIFFSRNEEYLSELHG